MSREEAVADASLAFRPELPMDQAELSQPGAMARLAEKLGAPMSILLEAEKITNGQRQADYGTALDNHERIARFWSAFLQNRRDGGDLLPEEVALMMALMKIARLQWSFTNRDGQVDLAGYANVLAKMGPQREERAKRLASEL